MSFRIPRTDNYRLCFHRLRPHIAYQIEFNRLNKHWVPKERKDEFEILFWTWLHSIEKKKYPGKISELIKKKGHKEALDVWHKLRVIKKDLLDEAQTKLHDSTQKVEAELGDIAEVPGEDIRVEATSVHPVQFIPVDTTTNSANAEEIMSEADLQPWAAPKLSGVATAEPEDETKLDAALTEAIAIPLPPSPTSLYSDTAASTVIDVAEEEQVAAQLLPKMVVLPEDIPLPPDTPVVF